MNEKAHQLRAEIRTMLEELQKFDSRHCLLQYKAMVDNAESASDATVELFNAHFFLPASCDPVMAWERLRDIVRINLRDTRPDPDLKIVPRDPID